MVELHGDEFPTAVDLTDHVLLGHPHVGVVGGRGDHTTNRDDGGPFEALGVGGHDDDADALMLGGIGVGATGQPHVVALIGPRRVDLVAVDDPLVAVQHGGGAQAGKVGAGLGLGVTDREVDLALQDAGEILVLLRLGAVRHDRRSDGVHGDEGERRVRALDLVEHDELIGGRTTLTAELFRPTETQPTVGAHAAHQLAEQRLALARLAQFGAHLGGEHGREILAEFLAKSLLVGCFGEVHERTLPHDLTTPQKRSGRNSTEFL